MSFLLPLRGPSFVTNRLALGTSGPSKHCLAEGGTVQLLEHCVGVCSQKPWSLRRFSCYEIAGRHSSAFAEGKSVKCWLQQSWMRDSNCSHRQALSPPRILLGSPPFCVLRPAPPHGGKLTIPSSKFRRAGGSGALWPTAGHEGRSGGKLGRW